MGAYLSSPVTEKVSTDEANDKLNCGTSSMQGWRESQEDAHNCIMDYDTNASYFAVYDGHGGYEVALYCSQKLPEFLKQLDLYKDGNFEKALEEAFLQFDATITTKEVIAELKQIRGSDCEAEEDSEDEEDVHNLYEEATMPIEQVIKKYTSNPALLHLAKSKLTDLVAASKHDDSSSNKSSTSKNSGEVVSSSSCAKNDVISSSNSSDEKAVSSGTTSKDTEEVNNDVKTEVKIDSPDSSGDAREVCTPSNDSIAKEVASQNGDVESTQNCDSKSDVSSSSTPHENGEVAKKGKGKALTKTKGVVAKRQSYKRRKSANQYYNTILSLDEGSEEESEDEKDETFEGPNDDSSDDEDTGVIADIEGNSDESSVEEEEDEDDEVSDEELDDERLGKYDNFLYNLKTGRGYESGCTAVVALLKDNKLYVANAGDSRCVVCRNGKAIEMSFDHKPEDKVEYSRINKAGGFVGIDGRVNGGLNLSRAIGDHYYKQNKELSDREQMITALPDVKTLTITPGEDEFMVLACDGIWNSMTSQEVVDFVKPRLQKKNLKLSQICGEMFDHCLSPNMSDEGTGCDNMTAVIVQFKMDALKRSAVVENEADHCKKMKTEDTEVST